MPTRMTPAAFSRAASSQSSMALKWVEGNAAIEPPTVSEISALNWAVPCINGAATMVVAGVSSGSPAAIAASTRSPASSGLAIGGTPRIALPPPPRTGNRSSIRHITPLGMPVVPPV